MVFKILKAKKIKINEVPHIVVKLTGKVPAKLVREIKQGFNQVVQGLLNPTEPEE